MDLTGTVAVVIGGNQGIGEAIAAAFARSGATLVLAARDAGLLELARARVAAAASGGSVDVRRLDVRSAEDLATFADEVEAHDGGVDVLVNSAGGGLNKPALEVTPDEFDRLIETHVRGTFFACQAFGRHMVERGSGSIVNLSSTWATTTAPGRSVYCTAKAGVGHLTASLATEWAPFGVRVNAIAPTSTRTPRILERIASDPSAEAWSVQRIPLGRLAEPDDVDGGWAAAK